MAQLIEMLNSSDAETRRTAAAELAWYGRKSGPALPALLLRLDDKQATVRIAAAAAVWEVDRQAGTIVPVLVELLHTGDPTIRTLSAYALGNIGPEAKRGLPDLHRVLESSQGLFRLNVAEAIVRIDNQDEKAIAVLTGALKHSGADIRCQASYALSAVSPDHAVKVASALSVLRQDDDLHVRKAVESSLSRLALVAKQTVAHRNDPDTQSVQIIPNQDPVVDAPGELQRLIGDLASQEPLVRKEASARLAWIGPDAKRALPALLGRLDDESAVVRAAAAWAVWEVDRQADRAIPVLVSMLDGNDQELATLAAYVIGSMRADATLALPSLQRAMANSRGMLRLHLAEAIAKIEPADRPSIDVLTAALHDANADVRSQAAFALSVVDLQRVGRVVPELVSVLNDNDERVRTASKLTLGGFLKSKQPGLRGLTAYVLGTLGPQAKPILPDLRDLLPKSEGIDRLQLAEAVVRIDPDDAESVDLLLVSLAEGDSDVRCQAAFALGSVNPQHARRVVDRLRTALHDRDPRVQSAAQLTLAEFRPAIKNRMPKLANVGGRQNPLPLISPKRQPPWPPASRAPDRPTARPRAVIITADKPATGQPSSTDNRQPTPTIVWSLNPSPVNAPVPQAEVPRTIVSVDPRPAPTPNRRLAPIPLEIEPGRLFPADRPPALVQRQSEGKKVPEETIPPTPETSSGYVGPEDIFTSDKSLLKYAKFGKYGAELAVDEEGNTQPLPEEFPETEDGRIAKQEFEDARKAAGFTDVPWHQPMGTSRGWASTSYYWEAGALCHRPLYFEEINLERYGNSFGLLQPVVSAAHFFGTVPLLPYRMVTEPPQKCTYTLGHYRPGSDIPFRYHRLPIRLDAALVEAATTWGLILLIN